MILVRRLRSAKIRKLILEQKAFYERPWTCDSILGWQLAQFNLQWKSITANVPFFQELKSRQKLPDSFSSWEEFKEKMPFMERQTAKNRRGDLMNQIKSPEGWVTTGGSTAEPLQIPIWKSEKQYSTKDLWYARSWFGINPADKLFLIWGHSHLLGTGMLGRLNGLKRRFKDAVLGYYRFSAYNLSEKRLKEAGEALLKFKPRYLMGYAVALDQFARVNKDRQADFHKLGLKVAIATAECFPKNDSAKFISKILGCPVVMEYGAVETGPIAHEHPDGNYRVFWRHYFLEGRPFSELNGTYEIFVTCLYPRYFPLIRYCLGDLVLPDPNVQELVRQFKAVIGRSNDCLVLGGGSVIHSEAFSHAVKEMSSVSAFQVRQSADREIVLNYVSERPLSHSEVAEIKNRLQRINPELANIGIERVTALVQTIAGKTRLIRSEVP